MPPDPRAVPFPVRSNCNCAMCAEGEKTAVLQVDRNANLSVLSPCGQVAHYRDTHGYPPRLRGDLEEGLVSWGDAPGLWSTIRDLFIARNAHVPIFVDCPRGIDGMPLARQIHEWSDERRSEAKRQQIWHDEAVERDLATLRPYEIQELTEPAGSARTLILDLSRGVPTPGLLVALQECLGPDRYPDPRNGGTEGGGLLRARLVCLGELETLRSALDPGLRQLVARMESFVVRVPSVREWDVTLLEYNDYNREWRGPIGLLLERVGARIRPSSHGYSLGPRRFTERAAKALNAYDWPGNFEEMRRVLEGAVVRAGDLGEVAVDHLPAHFAALAPAADPPRTLEPNGASAAS